MSFYNMINGFNPACVIFLPMLGRKPEDYPRFRDCFISKEGKHIEVYTRVGGGNRGCGYGEEELYKDPNFCNTYDDEFDSTYGTYVFNIPEEWKGDFDKIWEGKFEEVSDKYVERVKECYPNFAEDGFIEWLFKREDGEA